MTDGNTPPFDLTQIAAGDSVTFRCGGDAMVESAENNTGNPWPILVGITGMHQCHGPYGNRWSYTTEGDHSRPGDLEQPSPFDITQVTRAGKVMWRSKDAPAESDGRAPRGVTFPLEEAWSKLVSVLHDYEKNGLLSESDRSRYADCFREAITWLDAKEDNGSCAPAVPVDPCAPLKFGTENDAVDNLLDAIGGLESTKRASRRRLSRVYDQLVECRKLAAQQNQKDIK